MTTNRVLIGLAVAAGIATTAGSVTAQSPDDMLLPPNAKAGECYARIWVDPVYETEEVRVLVREASERVEIVPARYEWVEEQVLVKEGYQKMELVPAEYKWVEEEVLVKEASTELVEVPARYDWVEEKVLDRPAHTVWKKGKNPVQKVENGTGEIMCLVEVPATYKTVRKRVVVEGPATREVPVPAVHNKVKKKVLVKEETVRKIEVPAEFKTIKVRKLVSPAQEKRIAIPAEYDNVIKRNLVREGRMEWRAILCETNIQPGLVTDMQRALRNAGFDPGPIDGVVGSATLGALESYQRSKGLAQGGITIETLNSLGVRAGS